MLWQDFVLTAGFIVFAVALLPSIFSKNKPAISTSLVTGLVLVVMATIYVTLGLWFSAVTTFITGCLWLVLAGQKYWQAKREKKV